MTEKKKRKSFKQFTDELIGKINGLPIEQKLQAHLAWMISYRSGKKRPKRYDVQKRMLQIADDVFFWELQTAIENEDFERLNVLAREIYKRYENTIVSGRKEEEAEKGGVVLLPAIKEVNVGQAVEEKKGNMAAASRTPD